MIWQRSKPYHGTVEDFETEAPGANIRELEIL
jgi:hypothetical protein